MASDPKYDDLHNWLFEEGLKMRRSVVGDEYVNRALENGSTEFSRAGQELVTEWCWGYAWTRPGLEKKQRSLLNIGMLMALNRAPELAVHIRGARNNGLTELEIREGENSADFRKSSNSLTFPKPSFTARHTAVSQLESMR